MSNQLERWCREGGYSVAVAESLTGGSLAARIARLPNAGDWFRGGIVAYAPEVKFEVLGVPRGPVVSAVAAEAMATGVGRLLGSDLAIAVTGVGGPGSEEDQPCGTVWAALAFQGSVESRRWSFDGIPDDIVEATCDAAVEWLDELCTENDADAHHAVR